MRRVIHAIHANLAHGDDEQFLQLMRGVAGAGVNRFFRMILGLASGRRSPASSGTAAPR